MKGVVDRSLTHIISRVLKGIIENNDISDLVKTMRNAGTLKAGDSLDKVIQFKRKYRSICDELNEIDMSDQSFEKVTLITELSTLENEYAPVYYPFSKADINFGVYDKYEYLIRKMGFAEIFHEVLYTMCKEYIIYGDYEKPFSCKIDRRMGNIYIVTKFKLKNVSEFDYISVLNTSISINKRMGNEPVSDNDYVHYNIDNDGLFYMGILLPERKIFRE
jgi:hypothetical protein